MRTIINKPFNPRMFPGNAGQKQSIKRRFASDVKARCLTELTNSLKHHNGDIKKVLPALAYVEDIVVTFVNDIHMHAKACLVTDG